VWIQVADVGTRVDGNACFVDFYPCNQQCLAGGPAGILLEAAWKQHCNYSPLWLEILCLSDWFLHLQYCKLTNFYLWQLRFIGIGR
jgi:hypothetical protein